MSLDDFLIHMFHQGNAVEIYKVFGAHFEEREGVRGVRFSVYAPNANNVEIIGSFNQWQGQCMEKYNDGGIYTLFVPNVKEYDSYKFRIETSNGQKIDKCDPYAYLSEYRPRDRKSVV